MQHNSDSTARRMGLALMAGALVSLSGAASAAATHAVVPACAATRLRLSVDGRDGAFNGMSHGGVALSIRNFGPDCTLSAVPTLRFDDAHGKRLPVRFDAAAPARATPLRIAGGHRAETEVRWVAGPVYAHSRKVSAAAVGVRFGAAMLRAPLAAVMYGPSGQAVVVQQTALRPVEGMAADR